MLYYAYFYTYILQMGKRKSLDVSMKDKCVTQQAIACTLKINHYLWIQKSDFIVGNKSGGGRKGITNCRDKQTINRIVRKNRFSTLNLM